MDTAAFGRLTGHFLRGFVENDLLNPDEGMQATLAPILAGVAAPGLLLPTIWSFSYGWPYQRADEFVALAVRHEFLFVMLAMVVVGLVTVLQWDALYPDRRDYAVLGPLPVSLSTMFLAKLAALAAFVGLFGTAVNGLGAIGYPLVANMRPQPGSPGFLWTFIAHVAATTGAALFAALAVLGGLGLLQLLLPPRLLRPVASAVQLGTVLLLVLGLLMMPFLVAMVDHAGQGDAAELVSLHRLFSEDGAGTYDWLRVPSTSQLEPDPKHGGLRPKAGGEWGDVARLKEAFPGEKASNAVTDPRGPGGRSAWLSWCPPVWFLAWYERVAGRGGAGAQVLADRGWRGLLLLALAALACYLAAYRRHAAGAMLGASSGARMGPGRALRGVRARLTRLVARDPTSRACFSFTVRTLTRSAKHRLIMAAALGTGLAVVVAGLAASMRGRVPAGSLAGGPDVLSVQLVLIIFLLAGMRVAFTVPAALGANWAFRFHGPERAAECLAGARRAVMVCGVWPLLLILLPVHARLLGVQRAVLHLGFGVLVALLILETLLDSFPKVPFASAYVPGKARLRTRLILYLGAFEIYAVLLPRVEHWGLTEPRRALAVFGVALAAYCVMVARRTWRRRDATLVYDEEAPDAIQTLGLTGPPPAEASRAS